MAAQALAEQGNHIVMSPGPLAEETKHLDPPPAHGAPNATRPPNDFDDGDADFWQDLSQQLSQNQGKDIPCVNDISGTIIKVPGDGNCLFSAIALGLRQNGISIGRGSPPK